jgi:hypothetical protein
MNTSGINIGVNLDAWLGLDEHGAQRGLTLSNG